MKTVTDIINDLERDGILTITSTEFVTDEGRFEIRDGFIRLVETYGFTRTFGPFGHTMFRYFRARADTLYDEEGDDPFADHSESDRHVDVAQVFSSRFHASFIMKRAESAIAAARKGQSS